MKMNRIKLARAEERKNTVIVLMGLMRRGKVTIGTKNFEALEMVEQMMNQGEGKV